MILPEPMLLHEGRKTTPFTQRCWIYEIKHDGYHLIAGVSDRRVVLNTRNGADSTKWFPEVVEGTLEIAAGPHVIDGEVCVLDEIGRSNFDRLQDRARRRRWFAGCDSVTYCAFDLLALGGRSLIGLPLESRNKLLQELLDGKPGSTLFVGHFLAEHGAALYSQAVALKLEGLVAKRAGSLYVPGERSLDWIKCKVPKAAPPERLRRGAIAT